MPKVKLKDVVMRVKEKVDKDNTDLEFYVGGEHIDGNEIRVTRKGRIQGSTIGPAFHMGFKAGDVLLMSRNPHLRKASMVDFDGLCSDVSYICRTKDENVLLQSYLPFLMQSNDFWRFAEENKKGGLPFFLNWSDFERYEFDLPSIEKQRELSETLWAMQRTKEAYQDLLAKTDELVKSQFIELFGDSTIDQCPWPKAQMDDVFSITSSRRILKSEWKTEGSIPFIRVRDMVQLANKEPLTNEFFVSEEFYASRPDEEKVIPGDIIVSATSTIGKTYVIKPGERFYFKDADVLLFRKKQPINEVFFTYGLTQPTMWDQIAGGLGATTVAHFLISKACKLMQPMPPMELQERFAIFAQQSDKSKFELKKAIEDINNLMKSLMQQDFSE